MTEIRVLIADDQAVVRGGIRMILESQHDMAVVGEAADGSEAVALARQLAPDIVLMDIRMPIMDGIEATRRIASGGGRAPRILILTTYGIDEYVYDALKAGAGGFLVKTESPERLIEGVRIIARGEALLGPEVTRRLIEHFTSGPPPNLTGTSDVASLTDRELEVLKQIARGLSNAEIAERLYVSEGTVKTHVARILTKLRLRDRVQVVVLAYESGLVKPGRPLADEGET